MKILFFLLIVRPLVFVFLGLQIRNRERIPRQGPAILVANHNSHLDTLVLMSLFPLSQLANLRPAAAADYFQKNKILSWFASNIIGIIPVERGGKKRFEKSNFDPLAGISKAITHGAFIIFFPEGTRGEPEKMTEFKTGIARLSERHPEVPVVPFFLHGLGKALPKGRGLLVPFSCDIFVGEPIRWNGEKMSFLKNLETSITSLAALCHVPPWE